jgi:hypothetical protein
MLLLGASWNKNNGIWLSSNRGWIGWFAFVFFWLGFIFISDLIILSIGHTLLTQARKELEWKSSSKSVVLYGLLYCCYDGYGSENVHYYRYGKYQILTSVLFFK